MQLAKLLAFLALPIILVGCGDGRNSSLGVNPDVSGLTVECQTAGSDTNTTVTVNIDCGDRPVDSGNVTEPPGVPNLGL